MKKYVLTLLFIIPLFCITSCKDVEEAQTGSGAQTTPKQVVYKWQYLLWDTVVSRNWSRDELMSLQYAITPGFTLVNIENLPNHQINADGEIVDSIAPNRILAQYPNEAEGIAVNVSPERAIIYAQCHDGLDGHVNPILPMMVDKTTKRYKVYLTGGKYINYLSKPYYPTVKELYLLVRWKIITTGTTTSYEVSQVKVNGQKPSR